ncbi:DUF5700 domain-containing putative Zn-dependent protease [Clostridium hydrogenum]|uniref:DUF5700 domain-containing putative Zn-dependent protease n=1 Tax=Clostridium hydrogenum TaxID=2855764 RepID=UPI001F240D85|nr:DUF5700 domain-containing putative Zn-dependent protease [Clostridium hydrogenum]
MIIDTEIIDLYLNNHSLKQVENHWIFNSIVQNQHLFEEPKKPPYYKLKEIYKMLVKNLNSFEPMNKDIWKQFFCDMPIPASTKIYLIVGSPAPYDAMVRQDLEGNNCIILDLIRISSYSDDLTKLYKIVRTLITHEISHILIHNTYPCPNSDASLYYNLKYIVFDEGIAHFLSFKDDVLSVDWYSSEMNKRRKTSYNALLNALNNPDSLHNNKILEKSNSGTYWDKFGAISGLFAIVDYYNANGKNSDIFKCIFQKGSDVLIDFIINHLQN